VSDAIDKQLTSGVSAPRLTVVDPSGRADGLRATSDVRVVVAAGQALLRAGLRALLDGSATVAGEAGTGEEAVALAARLRPDVVLLDAGLPGLDYVEATRQMLPETGISVLLVNVCDADRRFFDALRAGATGALLQDAQPGELRHAVELLAQGGALLPPSFTRRLLDELASRPEPACPASDLLEDLTGREREVLALVGLALTNDEIAERLVVSPVTAKTHVSRAMVKLGARTRAELVVFAYETGLVVPRARSRLHARPLAMAR
jgi:DNA-binding NarL/FixJ family response regulator